MIHFEIGDDSDVTLMAILVTFLWKVEKIHPDLNLVPIWIIFVKYPLQCVLHDISFVFYWYLDTCGCHDRFSVSSHCLFINTITPKILDITSSYFQVLFDMSEGWSLLKLVIIQWKLWYYCFWSYHDWKHYLDNAIHYCSQILILSKKCS